MIRINQKLLKTKEFALLLYEVGSVELALGYIAKNNLTGEHDELLKKHGLINQEIKSLVESRQIIVIGKNTIQVSNELIKSWVEAYPKEFLEEEIKKAKCWVLANPHKSPKSNWGRFLNSWFSRGWERYRKTLKSEFIKMSCEDIMEFLK